MSYLDRPTTEQTEGGTTMGPVEPVPFRPLRDDSVYAAVAAARAEGLEWAEVSAVAADYCLCVLPPIYFYGGFLVSEPIRDDERWRAVYLLVTSIGARHFARQSTRSDAARLTDEFRRANWIDLTCGSSVGGTIACAISVVLIAVTLALVVENAVDWRR